MTAAQYRVFPLLSCFVQGCLDSGRDIAEGGALYNFLQPEAVGIPNVVDGLRAVETLVEEKQRFSLDDFRQALRDNFVNHDELQRAILRECPKHGNDEPGTNALFFEVADRWCDYIEEKRNYLGGPVLPGFLGWTMWFHFGKKTPATPDGRKAGTPLANSMGPCTGTIPKGAPAVILSASKLDQRRGLGGTTFNLRFNSNLLASSNGIEAFRGFVEASFELGTYMLQIDLASSELLRRAQQAP